MKSPVPVSRRVLFSRMTLGTMFIRRMTQPLLHNTWFPHTTGKLTRSLCSTSDMSRPVVTVRQGRLRGTIEENVAGGSYVSFKGIPYAKPPVGKLRFRDPEPPEAWSGTRDASEHGSHCSQLDLITRSLCGTDDCLYLNVYTTSINATSPRPVMFWIHGGAFVHGSGDVAMYGPDYLVQKDVVLVTINYRLGVLGFLNLEDEIAPGNQGLKDQVLALQWVQENISHFGGDPGNVTIFGESAGGASVHYLTLSPLARGLFHKAISQSGVATCPWASVLSSPKKYALQLSSLLGEKSTDSKKVLDFLINVDCQKLIECQQMLPTREDKFQLIFPFGPGVDRASQNPFLPSPLPEMVKDGVEVPYILGYNSHEGILTLAGLNDKSYDRINGQFEIAIPKQVLSSTERTLLTPNAIRKLYFGDEKVSSKNAQKYAEMTGDIHFVLPIHDVAKIQTVKSQNKIYLYRFSYDDGNSFMKTAMQLDFPGTCHADDLTYLFFPHLFQNMGVDPPQLGSTQHKVVQRFTQMWTDFAKTGNPTPVETELIPTLWQPLKDPAALHYLEINEQLRSGINPDFKRLLAWEGIKNKL